jgi:hypothetical protein
MLAISTLDEILVPEKEMGAAAESQIKGELLQFEKTWMTR